MLRPQPDELGVAVEAFLVHIWVPAGEVAPDTDLRGFVRHIPTGTETPFHGDEEVVRLLRRVAVRDGPK